MTKFKYLVAALEGDTDYVCPDYEDANKPREAASILYRDI